MKRLSFVFLFACAQDTSSSIDNGTPQEDEAAQTEQVTSLRMDGRTVSNQYIVVINDDPGDSSVP